MSKATDFKIVEGSSLTIGNEIRNLMASGWECDGPLVSHGSCFLQKMVFVPPVIESPAVEASDEKDGSDIEKLRPIQYEIVKEIMTQFERLGAGRSVFVALGSWGDTMPEADVLKMLQNVNSFVPN